MAIDWKKAFINKPEEKKEEEKEKVVQESITPPSVESVKVPEEIKTNLSTPISGKPNEKIMEMLRKDIQDADLPGPDLVDLLKVANKESMVNRIPNINSRFELAFDMVKEQFNGSTKPFNKDTLLESVDYYVKVLESHRKEGIEAVENQCNEEVVTEQTNLANADKTISDVEKQLELLLQKKAEAERAKLDATKKIQEAELNKQAKIAEFNASVDYVIKHDLTNLAEVIKTLNI